MHAGSIPARASTFFATIGQRLAEFPILSLGSDFFDPVAPADFPKSVLRFCNERWAERVGLGGHGDNWWIEHFGRLKPVPDNLTEPLAMRYHGHQFRVYNPEIGDGRGFTFAQVRDDSGRWLDLGTKGSGQTPYSRRGDGRLTLKGAVREILATEMLEALGVNTSKTFAVVETGESLYRGDEPSPTRSAVLTRLSHGHIRVGAFQRLAYFGETENIAKLTRYCLTTLYAEPGEDPVRLFDLVASATAGLAASYLVAGFVHGVLNSDNINVTGESFDYGPWRFTPFWDADFVAAYFDEAGLYSFGRQPEAIHWDIAQLGGSLALIADQQTLETILADWPRRFEDALVEKLIQRLGVAPSDQDGDRALASKILAALESRGATIDQFFFDWRGGRDPGGGTYAAEPFRRLAATLEDRIRMPSHPYWSGAAPCSMHIDEVEAIWAAIAENDDWQPLENKVKAIRTMGEAMRNNG